MTVVGLGGVDQLVREATPGRGRWSGAAVLDRGEVRLVDDGRRLASNQLVDVLVLLAGLRAADGRRVVDLVVVLVGERPVNTARRVRGHLAAWWSTQHRTEVGLRRYRYGPAYCNPVLFELTIHRVTAT